MNLDFNVFKTAVAEVVAEARAKAAEVLGTEVAALPGQLSTVADVLESLAAKLEAKVAGTAAPEKPAA